MTVCDPATPRNLWELTVLCLLRERPMHPYEMQRTIRQRRQDLYLDLKRGSLYHAIARLLRNRLIDAVATTREGRRPERTVYRITDEGEREVLHWLRDLLAKPVCETTQFFAAVALMAHLPPEEALDQLHDRIEQSTLLLRSFEGVLQHLTEFLPRALRLRLEYVVAMTRAEIAWVHSVTGDLRSGALTWGADLFKDAGRLVPPVETDGKRPHRPAAGDSSTAEGSNS